LKNWKDSKMFNWTMQLKNKPIEKVWKDR
jgi:hypothetical protein